MTAPTSRYRIGLLGCDDETRIWLDLTGEQLAVVQTIASAFEAVAKNTCQPTLLVSNNPIALAREHDDEAADYLSRPEAGLVIGAGTGDAQ